MILMNDLISDLAQLNSYLKDEFSEDVSKKVLHQFFNTFDSLGIFPKKGKDASTLMFAL